MGSGETGFSALRNTGTAVNAKPVLMVGTGAQGVAGGPEDVPARQQPGIRGRPYGAGQEGFVLRVREHTQKEWAGHTVRGRDHDGAFLPNAVAGVGAGLGAVGEWKAWK
ncbi:hypothetical protein GCM10017752_67500 [Streptomyces roseoviridis]